MRNRGYFLESGWQSGVTLIEVLVAMAVMLFGLLALAGLLAKTHTAEFESYQRKQAVILLEDIVGRITANRNAAACYVVTTSASAGTPFLGTGATASPSCAVGGGTPPLPSSEQAARAVSDLQEWSALLAGGGEVIGTQKMGAALDAKGCISQGTSVAGQYDEYRISVTWRGTAPLTQPSDDTLCAKGQYDTADELRRVISTVVRVPQLN